MRKYICKHCRWWKLYIKSENRHYCSLLSTGEQEVFTSSGCTCKGWQRKNDNRINNIRFMETQS